MAKKFTIRAPKSVKLHEMDEREIQKMVSKEADKMLDAIPGDYMPVGVNAVSVESRFSSGADIGGWAEWTRACCDRRNRIEDFTDPVINEFEPIETLSIEHRASTHVESQLRVLGLENPKMHGKK